MKNLKNAAKLLFACCFIVFMNSCTEEEIIEPTEIEQEKSNDSPFLVVIDNDD